MGQMFDVAIIGGGASGLACADVIKMNDKSISVCILEQLPRVGKKLLTTGNGRCNITNKKISLSRYHGENPLFCKYALSAFSAFTAEVFFNRLGVIFYYDEKGRAYPYSLQAGAVLDALRLFADQNGVKTLTDHKVTNIEKSKSGYKITAGDEVIKATNVVIAAGLLSGGEVSGSNGSMLEILKRMGYRTVETSPSIVPLKTENTLTKSLKGIKVTANATLYSKNEKIAEDCDEVLFCDYGLSGPAVMQISRNAARKGKDCFISLDIMPDYKYESVYDMIRYRATELCDRPLEDFFTGMLNKRVGQAIIKLCNLKLTDTAATLTADDFKNLAKTIKDLRFKVLGHTGYINSQVTAGGVDTSCFDDETMMSEKDEGLYCIGEILDIDGDCGGFNLQWAWSSAMCAAESVCDRLNDDENS